MKKTLSLFLMLMIFSGVVFAGNIDNPSAPATGVGVIQHGSMVKLFYKGSKPGTVKVTIYNDQGVEVFGESFRKTESFMRPYNFSQLNEGEYTIEVESTDGKALEKVSYYEGKVKSLIGMVKIADDEGRYLLTVANTKDTTLKIKIYDGAETLVYDGTEEIRGDFAKIYNVKSIFGKPTFEIIDEKGTSRTVRY